MNFVNRKCIYIKLQRLKRSVLSSETANLFIWVEIGSTALLSFNESSILLLKISILRFSTTYPEIPLLTISLALLKSVVQIGTPQARASTNVVDQPSFCDPIIYKSDAFKRSATSPGFFLPISLIFDCKPLEEMKSFILP